MGVKYDNPLKNPVIMKDFIFIMAKKPFELKLMLINSLKEISNVRENTYIQLKRKLFTKLFYLVGSFLFVFGLLDSFREYLR